jgi:hypothetical protein
VQGNHLGEDINRANRVVGRLIGRNSGYNEES